MSRDDYRKDVEALVNGGNRGSAVCPFDSLPCDFGEDGIENCDDVLSLEMGFDMVEGDSCPRAKYRQKKG